MWVKKWDKKQMAGKRTANLNFVSNLSILTATKVSNKADNALRVINRLQFLLIYPQ